MMITENPENRPSSAYGEFEDFGLPQTDEEWAEYDAYVAAEMDKWDAQQEEAYGEFYVDLDPEPPF